MSWEIWHFAFNVTMPNLLLLLLGMGLRRLKQLDDAFCDAAMKLVFNLALPCLLFFSVASSQQDASQHLPMILYGAVGTIATFLLLEFAAVYLVKNPRERGIFVQGGFRSNTGIMGLAFAMRAYGEEGVAIGSLYLTVTVILFNVLSVITLSRSLRRDEQGGGISMKALLTSIITNPLIIGLLLGMAYSHSGVPMPEVMKQTGKLVSSLALPLALLCAGASLDLKTMLRTSNVAALSSAAKLLVVPFLLTLGGWLVGFHCVALGIIFLFSSSPTAAGSYAMTRAMGGNATLAANIIAMTTVGSFFATAFGLYLLRAWGIA